MAIHSNLKTIVDHDGAVILDIQGNTITRLNSTGAYIWQRLERELRMNLIVSELARDTGADETIVAKDVHEFIAELENKRLLISFSLMPPTTEALA